MKHFLRGYNPRRPIIIHVERQFSLLFASEAGAALKIIKSGKFGARDGAGQLFDLLKAALAPR